MVTNSPPVKLRTENTNQKLKGTSAIPVTRCIHQCCTAPLARRSFRPHFNGDPIFTKPRPQEVKIASCSADKARKLLGYKTMTSLKESIKSTTNYIKKRGVRPFNYNLPLEISSDITPDTWKKRTI